LNNVWRHAKASSVQIGVQHTSPRALMVTIEDDGLGFTDGVDISDLSKSGHFGLLGISERVALLGGRMRLQRQHKGGSLLQVEIPHPRVSTEVEVTG
jgi:signal transduction histidine kinase